MLQCIFCQDWYHDSCLGETIPVDIESFDEFICGDCAQAHPFSTAAYDHMAQGPKYLEKGWRETLCKCDECTKLTKMYPFIAQEPVFWEPDMEEAPSSPRLYSILSDKITLDRGLMAYAKLKDSFSTFLKTKQAESSVITKEDVETFFNGIKRD